ncbi:MAG: PspA/IM30 family protein [Gammaproteobacteria bacterium]|nr:PspA/IM30 family protein [Gammaproteobacteria bacterium]
MGIFQKLSTLIKSNMNDLIAKAENPEKMLNQIILDMRDQLAKAKRDVAGAIADERKLGAQLDAEVKQAQAWKKRAELAVREGRDDLAMQALSRQQEHTQRAGALEQTWRAQKEETEKLKASLRTLNDKIEEAKRKRNLLIAKQKRAQAQKRIHATMSGLSDQSAFEAFNRMAAKIEEEERRSLAQAEVTEALTGDSLEDEFTRLESGGEGAALDDRLLALKAQMGLLPGGAPEAPRQLTAGEGSGDAPSEVDAEADDADAGSSASVAPIQEAQLLEEFERLGRNDGS